MGFRGCFLQRFVLPWIPPNSHVQHADTYVILPTTIKTTYPISFFSDFPGLDHYASDPFNLQIETLKCVVYCVPPPPRNVLYRCFYHYRVLEHGASVSEGEGRMGQDYSYLSSLAFSWYSTSAVFLNPVISLMTSSLSPSNLNVKREERWYNLLGISSIRSFPLTTSSRSLVSRWMFTGNLTNALLLILRACSFGYRSPGGSLSEGGVSSSSDPG